MFDALKAAGALAGLMKNKEAIAEAAARVQASLLAKRIEGRAGGGAVTVTVNGKMQAVGVRIDPMVFTATNDDARHMLEQLLVEAFNEASARAQQVIGEEIKREAQALGLPNIPGLDALLSR